MKFSFPWEHNIFRAHIIYEDTNNNAPVPYIEINLTIIIIIKFFYFQTKAKTTTKKKYWERGEKMHEKWVQI